MIKENDYLNTIADQCLSKAKKLGSTEASVFVVNSVSENVNIRNRKLDGSTRSENLGITLTTYIGKKKSSISSSNLSEKNLDNLINRCVESTKITPEDELNSLADKELYFNGDKNLDLYDETISSAVSKNFPFISIFFSIYCDDNTLRAKFFGTLNNNI